MLASCKLQLMQKGGFDEGAFTNHSHIRACMDFGSFNPHLLINCRTPGMNT